MTNDTRRLRLAIIGVIALSLFAPLFARLYYLQVLAAPEYQLAAESNRVRLVAEPAPRGRILDANGAELVSNRMMVVVTIDRDVLGDLERDERNELLYRLARLVGRTKDDLEAALEDQRISPFAPVPVAEDVTDEVVVHLREHRQEYPSVNVGEVAVRTYPNLRTAAHLLGYVGEINDEELAERRADGYRLGDQVGKAGIERVYESDLRGEPGLVKLEVDANGRVLRELSRRAPVQGHDVRLTLDLPTQRLAEDTLRQALEAARTRRPENGTRNFKAPAGAVVVLNDKGSVVAMASNPDFDPAEFVNGISTEEYRVLTDEATGSPFTNRPVQGLYAPGSTFKLISAAAGLGSGIIAPSSTLVDRGTFVVENCTGNCDFRNAQGRSYGTVNVARALSVSSDVFFYDLGHDLWRRREQYGETPIQDTAAAFGLGSETGVPIPSEHGGRIPTPASQRAALEGTSDVFQQDYWFIGDNIQLAIGQGDMLVTPLQMANAYATFGNGGTRYAPNVASAVLDHRGEVLRAIEPRVAATVEMSGPTRSAILQGLRGAVTDRNGTATNAFSGFPHGQYPIAGKTGTAQITGKQDTALFVAFAPAEHPSHTVAVVLEESGFGSVAAAPVARALFAHLSGLEQPRPPQPAQGHSG